MMAISKDAINRVSTTLYYELYREDGSEFRQKIDHMINDLGYKLSIIPALKDYQQSQKIGSQTK